MEFFDLSYVKASASQKYEIFLNIISSSIVENTPKRKIVDDKIHRNPVKWWDEECSKMKRLRRAAFKKWKLTKKLDDRIEYERRCAVMRRTIKKKQKAYYVKFTETIDLNKNAGYVWEKMKLFKNKWQKVNHSTSNHQDKSFRQMANETLNKLTSPPSFFQSPVNTQPQPNPFFDQLFT